MRELLRVPSPTRACGSTVSCVTNFRWNYDIGSSSCTSSFTKFRWNYGIGSTRCTRSLFTNCRWNYVASGCTRSVVTKLRLERVQGCRRYSCITGHPPSIPRLPFLLRLFLYLLEVDPVHHIQLMHSIVHVAREAWLGSTWG